MSLKSVIKPKAFSTAQPVQDEKEKNKNENTQQQSANGPVDVTDYSLPTTHISNALAMIRKNRNTGGASANTGSTTPQTGSAANPISINNFVSSAVNGQNTAGRTGAARTGIRDLVSAVANDDTASLVGNYITGGNYSTKTNEFWKGRLNSEIEQLTASRDAYSSGSRQYSAYNELIGYYNSLLNDIDRINVGTSGLEFVNSTDWHTAEDFASQKSVIADAWSLLSSERDALDKSASDYKSQYDYLTAYMDYYDSISKGLDETEKFYSRFKDIDDYTAYEKRDDWEYQNDLSNTYNTLQAERNELESLLSQTGLFGGVINNDARDSLQEKYGSVREARARLEELDGQLETIAPQYESAAKWRDSQIAWNYSKDTNNFSLDGYDYSAEVDRLESAKEKATNDADRFAIQSQIDILKPYADMQSAEKTDVKAMQAQADEVQDKIREIKFERAAINSSPDYFPTAEERDARLKELDSQEQEYTKLLYGKSGGDDDGVFEEGSLRGQIQDTLSWQKQAAQIRFRTNPNSNAEGADAAILEGKKHVRRAPGNAGGSPLQYQTADGKWHDVTGSGAGDLMRTLMLSDKQYDKEAYTTEDRYEYTSEEAKADALARLDEFYATVGNTYLGKENANGSTVEDYLDYLNDFENQSAAERFNRTVDTWGDDANGVLGKAIGHTARWTTEAVAVPFVAGVESGITNPVQGVKAIFGTDDDPNLMRQTMLNAISNASMQDLDTRHGNENFLGTGRSVSQLFFEAAQTSGNMLPAMGLAALTAGMSSALGMGAEAVGTIQKMAMSGVMGLGATGSTYQQTVQQGYSVADAKLYSALSGLSEWASEYWVGGVVGTMGVGEEQLMKAASGIVGTWPRFIAEMGIHIGSEALEEYAQNKVEPLLKNIFLGQSNDISLFDQDDWYTILVTTLSTGAMEAIPTYRNTFKANKIGKERYAELSKTIQSKAQLEGKAKADQAVADAGEMLAGSKGVVRAMQEIADFFVPEGENGKAFSENMQEMAKGLVSKNGKVNTINLGRMYAELCSAIGTEQAGVLLSAAALKAGTVLKAQDRVSQKQAAVDAVLANNPGAVVLSEQEAALKNAGLNLQAAQTGAVILGKVMDGTNLSADELTLVAGESKTGKAIRAVLSASNPTITANMTAEAAKAAVTDIIKKNADIAEANAAAEGQEIVNAGVKAMDQNEVLKAKQKAYSPSAATELFNAENELAGAQEALKSVEGASLDRTVRAEAIGLNEAMTGNLMDLAGADKALKNINAAISEVDAEIKALEGDGKQVLSKAKQARLAELRNEKKSLLEQKKNIQSRVAEIRAEEETKLKAKEKPVAAADVSGYNEFTDPATGIKMTRADYVADMVKQGLTEEEANKRFNDLLKQAGVKVEGANANEQKSGSDRTGRTPDVGGRENGGEDSERGDRPEQGADSGRAEEEGRLREESYVDDALPEEIGRVKNGGRVLDTQEILGDKELAGIFRELQDLGIKGFYVVDGLCNTRGQSIAGVFDPATRSIAINLQADAVNQAVHEEGHSFIEAIAEAFGIDTANKYVASCLENVLDEDTYERMLNAYWSAYEEAYPELSVEDLQFAINEEIFNDILGKIDRYGLGQSGFHDNLKKLVDSSGVFDIAKAVYAKKDPGKMNDTMLGLTNRQLTQPFNAAVEGVDAVNDASGGILNFRGQKESVALEKTAQPKQVTIVTASDTRAQRTETDSSVREIRNEVMRDHGFSEADIKFVNDFFDDFGKVMERLGVKYEYVGLADVENARIQVNPITGQITLSAMVNNGEYPVNFDFTKVCKKREALTEVMDYLAALKGQDNGDGTFTEVNLSPENIRAISDILTTKYGIETNCLGCFVETKRAKIQHSYEDQVIHDWNKLVDELNPGADYFNFSKGQLDLTSIPDSEFEALEKEIKAIQEKEDFIDKENARIDRENKKREKMGLPKLPKISRPKAALDKAREYLTASPSSAKKLTFADLVIPEARTRLVRDYPFIESYIAARLGTSAPKSTEVFAPYNAEIELLRYGMNGTDDDLLRYIKSIAGVRSQSFSDFIITHIYDVMQKTAGLAAKGLPAHTYTKELARAYLTGLTGEKINMSAIFDIDSGVSSWSAGLGADGKYLLTDPDAFLAGKTKYVQSVPFEKAKALQKMDGYSSNCGIIGVGYSYFHMLEMFRDDDIRQVIGYHASNMDPSLKIMTNLIQAADYTGVQNTLQIGDAEGNMFAVPLYKRPDGVPSYATPPQDATAKRDENGEYLFNKKGELQKDTASVTISKSVAYFDIKGKYAEKLQAMSPAAAAKATLSELLEYANSNGYTIITSKAEAGHGNFELYADVEATKDPRTTADNYIDYCIKQGYLPMFYEFAMEDGYYKQVFDCNMYDRNTGEYAPMNPVRLFDTDENGNRKMLLPDDFFAAVEKEMRGYNSAKKQLADNWSSIVDDVVNITDRKGKPMISTKRGQRYSLQNLEPDPAYERIIGREAKYSIISDQSLIDRLENEEYYTTYKTMQVEYQPDGSYLLYPPMNMYVNGKKVEPSRIGQWEQADESPDSIKVDAKGKESFDLRKGGKGKDGRDVLGKPTNVVYNPYIHTSNLMINDQFSEAYNRPNLVTVEVAVPKSEDNGAYRAYKAHDPTGWKKWHTGPVGSALAHTGDPAKNRRVFLSRYMKPLRIVPDAETAQHYKDLVAGTDIKVPDNVVWPNLLKEMQKIGVPIKKSGKVSGAKFSLQPDAPAEIHSAVTDKNYGGDVKLTDTSPKIMLGHKGVKNLPLVMKASHIRENILTEDEASAIGLKIERGINYHGLGEDLFKQVIENLDSITLAYRGTRNASDPARRENSFLLISNLSQNGVPIMVPVFINEGTISNRVFIPSNRIASVYGKDGLMEYLRREVSKGNLVRIKNRGPISSESPAPIAVDYAGVTSAEEAADQTAMASYVDSVPQPKQKRQEKFSLPEDSTASPNNFKFSLQTPPENIETITDKVISGTLFSGGGMVDTAVASLIHSSFAVEYDDRIQGVYLDNNDTDYMGKDVLDFDPAPYAGKLEWLHASPVCKSFSPAISESARKNREDSKIDEEFARRIVRSIEVIGSKIVTIEQVPRYKGTVYAEMIKQALRDNGYIFNEGVYNSADYGSATSRERYFLRAVKRGGKLPPMQKTQEHRGWITAVGEEMLNSLPEAKTVNPRMLDSLKRLSGIDLNNLPEPLLVFGESYKNKEYGHAFASDPLPTIIANSGASRIFMPDGRILDCTPDVLKLISGLPAEYKLPSQVVDARTIVGNGVPVELTRAVVGSMLKANFPEKVGNTKFSLQSKSKQRADKEINIIPPKQAMEQDQQALSETVEFPKTGKMLTTSSGFIVQRAETGVDNSGYNISARKNVEESLSGDIERNLRSRISSLTPEDAGKWAAEEAVLRNDTRGANNALDDLGRLPAWAQLSGEQKEKITKATYGFLRGFGDEGDLFLEYSESEEDAARALYDNYAQDPVVREGYELWRRPLFYVFAEYSGLAQKEDSGERYSTYAAEDSRDYYHGGDLGKSESFAQQSGGRDTGHFGTGTYFVHNKAQLERGGYANRPVEKVNFNKYNLYTPRTNAEGMALHEFLKGVNYYYDRSMDKPQTSAEYDAKLQTIKDILDEGRLENEPNPYDELELNDDFDWVYPDGTPYEDKGVTKAAFVEAINTIRNGGLSTYGLNSAIDRYYPIEGFVDRDEIPAEELYDKSSDPRAILWGAYDYLNDWGARREVSRYEEWQNSFSQMARQLGISETDLRAAVDNAKQQIKDEGLNWWNKASRTADSASTRVMKTLGYEGVDVRDLSQLDNTTYGSVIYDLKDEDLARKKEIGTARYSIVDPQDIQDAIDNLDLPSAGLYPPDSLESDFVKVLSEGGAKALSDYVTKVMYDYEQAQKNAQGRQTIPPKGFVPKMTKAERDAQDKAIAEKGKQYGFIPRKEKEVRDASLPLSTNGDTRIRQHARTVKGAESINEEAVGYTNRAAMTDVQMSYTPDSNAADIKYAEKFIGSNGYEKSLGMFYGMASSTNIPTTQAIAVGEQLLIETANEEDWDNFNKVLAAVCEMGTQIGKSLQAFTLLKKSGPLGQLYYIRRAVDRLNQKTYADMIQNGKMKPITIDEALARAVYTAADEDARQAAVDNLIAEVAKQVPVTLKDRWDAWRHFAMLGNVRTHMNNIVGNALFKPLLFTKDILKAGMEGTFIKNKSDRTTDIAERFGADAGGYRAFAKNDAIAMKSALQGNGKFNPANAIMDARKVLGPLDSLAKWNGEMMEKEDWIFLKSAYVDSLSQILANKGIPVDELYNTPEGMEALTEARKTAMIEAQKATYRDYSAVATALNNFKRIKTGKGKIAAAALEGVLPFTKTPINILARAVEYSPLEVLEIMRDIYNGARGNPTATANEIIDKAASTLTGTGFALLGFLLAKSGLLRGRDDDDDEEAFAKLQGYQDYALVFDGPDGETHTLTLDWAAPSSLPLFTGVAAYQVLSQDEDLNFYDTLNAALMIAEPMLSMSMLDGLNDVIGSASFAEDNRKLLTIAGSSFESYLGQAFPTVMGQLARSLDGTRRKSYQDKNSSLPGGVQYFIQSNIQNKTPGWEEKKVPYIDQWGRTDTVQNKFLGAMENFLSPGYFSTVRTTPLDEELARLKKATAGSDLDLGSIYPPDLAGVKKFTVNGETHNMTGEEWTRFATEVGKANFDTLNDVISDPRYLRLSDEAKAKAISYFYDYNKYVGYWNIDNNYNLNGQGKWIVTAHDEPTETGRMNVIWDKIEDYLGSSNWKGN